MVRAYSPADKEMRYIMKPKTEKPEKEEHREDRKTLSEWIEEPILLDHMLIQGTYLPHLVTEHFYFRSKMHKVKKKESPTKTV